MRIVASAQKCGKCGESCCDKQTVIETTKHVDREPGFVDIAMHVMEALNSPYYNVTEHVTPDGMSTFRIFLKDDHGHNSAMVAIVTYNPKRGTVLVQQAYNSPGHVSVMPIDGGAMVDAAALVSDTIELPLVRLDSLQPARLDFAA